SSSTRSIIRREKSGKLFPSSGTFMATMVVIRRLPSSKFFPCPSPPHGDDIRPQCPWTISEPYVRRRKRLGTRADRHDNAPTRKQNPREGRAEVVLAIEAIRASATRYEKESVAPIGRLPINRPARVTQRRAHIGQLVPTDASDWRL